MMRPPEPGARNAMTDQSAIQPEAMQRLAGAVGAGVYLMIAGPTASGKSALALEVALATGGVVINADSMQLYRDLHVLTARPSADDEARAPHRLYGVVDGARRASVASWLEMAGREVEQARADGRLPILVGGTGMYLQAASDGIAPIPEVPGDIHDALVGELRERGGAAMRAELARSDPGTAQRLFDGDSQRLVRALGVFRATGRPISAWQGEPHRGAVKGRAVRLALVPPREKIYSAIDERFAGMLRAGAVDEVRRLAARGLDAGLPVMKALGVREIMAMERGEIDGGRAGELASRDTRHYAKRQLTWIRNNYNAKTILDGKLTPSDLCNIIAILISES